MPPPTIRIPAHSDVPTSLGSLSRRVLSYAGWVVGCCLLLLHPVLAFAAYALANDNASHLLLIPFISAWILFLERDKIFKILSSDLAVSFVFFLGGAAFALVAFSFGSAWTSLNRLSVYIFALVLLWIAGFAFFFGRTALNQARFPLAFLLLAIPIPDFLLDKAIYLLQKGSAEIAAVLFDWSGVPVLREGFVFHLAHVNIEVARECSGIRSSLALLILAILVAYFYFCSLRCCGCCSAAKGKKSRQLRPLATFSLHLRLDSCSNIRRIQHRYPRGSILLPIYFSPEKPQPPLPPSRCP